MQKDLANDKLVKIVTDWPVTLFTNLSNVRLCRDALFEYHLAFNLILFLNFLVVTAYLFSRTFDGAIFENLHADLYGDRKALCCQSNKIFKT